MPKTVTKLYVSGVPKNNVLRFPRNLRKPIGKQCFGDRPERITGWANPRVPGIPVGILGETLFSACPGKTHRLNLTVIQKPSKTIGESMFSPCQEK